MLKYHLWKLRRSFQSTSRSTIEFRRVNIAVEQQSTRIINTTGYVILFLILLDYSFLLSSFQIFDPNWAFNTAGTITEQVWRFLLGFLFVFYRRDQDLVEPKESKLLYCLSWCALMIGIIYFLITPIIIGNAIRLDHKSQAEIVSQLNVQNNQVKQYSRQLEQATSEQLNNLFKNYQDASNKNVASMQQLKTTLIDEAKQQQAIVKQQLQTKLNQNKITLIKTSVKRSIGAVISGMCFIFVWKWTAWTRLKS